MTSLNNVIKKRGRKPKNVIEEPKIINPPLKSEDEQIIVHLPISLDDVVNVSSNKHNDDEELKMFIKSEDVNKSETINSVNNNFIEMEKMFLLGNNINKVNIYNIYYKPGNKCLWCKHSFDSPAVVLPENYYNNTFYCDGNYCSWNCAKAYNIDLNDTSTWKRNSLLNLMYYKTYGVFKEINSAPSWLLLEDFGGFLCIIEFRKLFLTNTKDYLVLHPPLITRQLQIEESYKKQSICNSNKSEINNDFILKRIKPLENNNLNLERTLGLKRKMKKNIDL